MEMKTFLFSDEVNILEIFLSGSDYAGGLKQLYFNDDTEEAYTPDDVEYYLTVRHDDEINGFEPFPALAPANCVSTEPNEQKPHRELSTIRTHHSVNVMPHPFYTPFFSIQKNLLF